MRRPLWILAACSTLSLACQRADPPQAAQAVAPADEPAPVVKAAEPVDHHGVAWFEDALEAAQAHAKRENKPLFVDLWAPWCHTCLSMKNFVLTRDNLGELASAFVFLSINTEKSENAALLGKLPVEAWPTFYVADADTLAMRGRLVGAASPATLGDFMRDGQRAFVQARAGESQDVMLSKLVSGDQLAGARKYADAARAYAEALAVGGDSWARKPDALVSQITALYKAHDYPACVALAEARMDDTGHSVSVGDFASYALACASEVEPRARKSLQKRVEKRLGPACEDEGDAFTLSPDDRSDVCAILREARDGLGDEAGARRAAERRLTILEAAQRGLPDDVALTYDWARAETLVSLGRAAEALPLLEARKRALPRDYNPSHYLARVYKALGRWDEGLAELEQALALAYGPRRVSMFGLKADLLEGKGQKEQAMAAIKEQLALYRALPAEQRRESSERQAEARLAALEQAK